LQKCFQCPLRVSRESRSLPEMVCSKTLEFWQTVCAKENSPNKLLLDPASEAVHAPQESSLQQGVRSTNHLEASLIRSSFEADAGAGGNLACLQDLSKLSSVDSHKPPKAPADRKQETAVVPLEECSEEVCHSGDETLDSLDLGEGPSLELGDDDFAKAFADVFSDSPQRSARVRQSSEPDEAHESALSKRVAFTTESPVIWSPHSELSDADRANPLGRGHGTHDAIAGGMRRAAVDLAATPRSVVEWPASPRDTLRSPTTLDHREVELAQDYVVPSRGSSLQVSAFRGSSLQVLAPTGLSLQVAPPRGLSLQVPASTGSSRQVSAPRRGSSLQVPAPADHQFAQVSLPIARRPNQGTQAAVHPRICRKGDEFSFTQPFTKMAEARATVPRPTSLERPRTPTGRAFPSQGALLPAPGTLDAHRRSMSRTVSAPGRTRNETQRSRQSASSPSGAPLRTSLRGDRVRSGTDAERNLTRNSNAPHDGRASLNPPSGRSGAPLRPGSRGSQSASTSRAATPHGQDTFRSAGRGRRTGQGNPGPATTPPVVSARGARCSGERTPSLSRRSSPHRARQ